MTKKPSTDGKGLGILKDLLIQFMKTFFYRRASTRFLYKHHFYKQYQAEIGKNQANAEQHFEAKLLLFENYSHSLSTLSKTCRTYSKK